MVKNKLILRVVKQCRELATDANLLAEYFENIPATKAGRIYKSNIWPQSTRARQLSKVTSSLEDLIDRLNYLAGWKRLRK